MKKVITTLLVLLIANAHAECTSKDLTDPEYLRSMGKEKLIQHFTIPRDQDSMGWCGAFASSDSLSFSVGEPISAIDVSVNFYANDKNLSDIKLNKLQLISPLSSTYVARVSGYCPESVIPSNQTSSSNLGNSAILILMDSFQKIYDDYVSKGRPANYCVECSEYYVNAIKPSLPNVTVDIMKKVLLKNQRSSLATFKDLLDKLCEGKRIKALTKFDVIYKNKLRNKKIANVLDEALNNNSMPTIGMNTAFFTEAASVPGGHGPHSLMVVARRMGDKKCEYLVRNSWGRGCNYYQPEIKAKCDAEKGAFWMDQDQLEAGVTDVLVIKNKKSAFGFFKKN